MWNCQLIHTAWEFVCKWVRSHATDNIVIVVVVVEYDILAKVRIQIQRLIESKQIDNMLYNFVPMIIITLVNEKMFFFQIIVIVVNRVRIE